MKRQKICAEPSKMWEKAKSEYDLQERLAGVLSLRTEIVNYSSVGATSVQILGMSLGDVFSWQKILLLSPQIWRNVTFL